MTTYHVKGRVAVRYIGWTFIEVDEEIEAGSESEAEAIALEQVENDAEGEDPDDCNIDDCDWRDGPSTERLDNDVGASREWRRMQAMGATPLPGMGR